MAEMQVRSTLSSLGTVSVPWAMYCAAPVAGDTVLCARYMVSGRPLLHYPTLECRLTVSRFGIRTHGSTRIRYLSTAVGLLLHPTLYSRTRGVHKYKPPVP